MMPVTPGFGAAVATELKGNAHHQRVIVHDDVVRAQVNPAVSAATYAAGQCVGGEMTFAGVARLVGDACRLEAVHLSLTGTSVAADMHLVLYPDNLAEQPVNGAPFVLTDVDARGVQAVLTVAASDFKSVGGQQFATVVPPAPVLLRAAGGLSSMRAVLVAGGALVPAASDSIAVTLVVRRS